MEHLARYRRVWRIARFFALPWMKRKFHYDPEICMEEDTLSVGDDLLIIGPTTGVYEDSVQEIRVEDQSVETVSKGVYCSVKVKELVRRGDQVYRWIWVKDEF